MLHYMINNCFFVNNMEIFQIMKFLFLPTENAVAATMFPSSLFTAKQDLAIILSFINISLQLGIMSS